MNQGSRIELSEATPKKVFCTQCGTENSVDAAFCKNCGAPLEKIRATKTRYTAPSNVNMETKGQEQPGKRKSIPKIGIILLICVVVIGIAVFVIFTFKDDADPDKNVSSGDSSPETENIQATPFTEYIALIGSDYKELYSDEYDVTEIGGALGQYIAHTEIPFMDIDGVGSFQFFHAEDEDTQSALDESGTEKDTVLGFQWACDASVYSLDDVCASFESIYGNPPMHGVYSLGSKFGDRQVESYCWENVEGGYDLELYLETDATAITASWSVSPEVEGSYNDVVSTLKSALEERDTSAYEGLLYEDNDVLSASNSTKEELADIISNEEIDKIVCHSGDAVKVTTYANLYLMSGNYSASSSELEQIKSLYFVNMDLLLYQNENIISAASCKIDIAYIDGEWKILGIFQNDRFSDTLLVEFAKQYYESVNGNVPPNVEVDHYEGDNVVIHLYEISNNATSTWDWYTINPYTLEGTDFLGNEVRLYEAFNASGQ